MLPCFEEAEGACLLEVTCDSDKLTRSSTSAGCIFLGGDRIHSYARTQKNISPSSTEAGYVGLVSGASEGAKRLSGRLLWLQQRQGRDLDFRKLDAMTNPADIGTKARRGKKVNMLLFLMGFTDDSEELGKEDFEAERMKQDEKKRLQEVRRMVWCLWKKVRQKSQPGKPTFKVAVETHYDGNACGFSLEPGCGELQ